MPITFYPKQGTVLICDYSGFVAPEMIKKRPVVVVSPRLRRQQQLFTVIPLSTSKPTFIEHHHHKLNLMSLPNGLNQKETWAKCDMIARVSGARLDRVRVRAPNGKRIYVDHTILPEDLQAIMRGILYPLGLHHLTQHV